MTELVPGSSVSIESPQVSLDVYSPHFVNGVLVKEGPPGPPGRNVTSVDRTSGTGAPGSTDTYTITFSDSTTTTFSIVNGTNGSNGRGITSVVRTGGTGAAGTTDTYTITFTDASTTTFTVVNGANGSLTGAAGGDLSGTYPNPTVKPTAILAVAASNTQGGAEKTAPLSATTGTSTANCALASWFYSNGPLTGNITLVLTNPPPAGTVGTFTVEITQGSTAYTVTMPPGTTWGGSSAPTQAANKKCVITMATRDGGTTWLASGLIFS